MTIVRRRLLAISALCCLWGCSQATSPIPGGYAQVAPRAAGIGRAVLPTLEYFNTPSSDAWPEFIVAGPQRALWFTEFFTGNIGRIETDGAITEFPLPPGDTPEGITEGADGNLWVTEPGASRIGRMTPRGAVTTFEIAGSNPSPRGITLGPDGNVWYVEFYDGYIGRVTPKGVITRFEIPAGSPFPWDITTGPDGDLWFTESEINAIGRFNPKTLTFDASLPVPTQNSTPWGILLAPDKHIWFTERTGDKIAEVVGSGEMREFKIAQAGSYPEMLAPGSDGNLWFTESQTGDLGRINPVTGKFGKILVLPSGSIPNGIASGANKNLFFTIADYTEPSQIGEVVLNSKGADRPRTP